MLRLWLERSSADVDDELLESIWLNLADNWANDAFYRL